MGYLPYDPENPPDERSWMVPVAILGLVLLLLVTLTGGALVVLAQQRELRDLRRQLTEARDELAETRAELEEARATQPEEDGTEGDGDGLGGLLDDLLGDLGDALGEDGLGGLLDDLGGGLGGDVDRNLVACLAEAINPGPQGVRPIEGDAREQVAAIAERVEEIRGLSFDGEVQAEFLGPEEFAEEVRRTFEEDYDPASADLDQRILTALGAIPRGTDLRSLYRELISTQAIGFYNPETGQIVVRAEPGEELSPTAQVTLAHEIEHALSDQHFGLPELDGAEDSDAARANLALIEGGASLAMQQFTGRSLGPGAQLQLGLDPSLAQSQEQLATYPHYLQRDLTFPYEEGLAFACELHTGGGWPAIDDAYSRPPTTSAQILWPERWREGEGAVEPPAGAAVPEGWMQARTTTIGAADLLWLFEAPGDDPDAALDEPLERVAEWAGGRLRLLTRDTDSAVEVSLVPRSGESDLCDSIATWYRAAHPDGQESAAAEGERLAVDGEDQDAVLRCSEGLVRLTIAPELDTARALQG